MNKIKVLSLSIVLLLAFQHAGAQRYISKNGHVWFYSHTPLEDIEARNNQVVSILDVPTGTIQFSLLIKSFEFRIALLEEHFNENYMESDQFPKADFTGKISNLDKIDFSQNGNYTAVVNGDLTIHGVTKNLSVPGTLEVKDGKIIARAQFIVKPQDFDIEIPSVVEDKIAREIEVNVDLTYNPN